MTGLLDDSQLSSLDIILTQESTSSDKKPIVGFATMYRRAMKVHQQTTECFPSAIDCIKSSSKSRYSLCGSEGHGAESFFPPVVVSDK
jgi:hypothetical protein